ncbi:GNAT family N-acetyltransferase [Pseudomonas oryzihabitans]|uniref:GNAT family N-acetyltransferase n=1 Tax=Pseudomonas oryzihabitans TaxID=47885 RepID=UPI00135E045C|nr:GNAT family N-acetyltransferase [Pseudomonas oryzihabitans]MXS19887.1 GNAT family N-acetyltransferase [Pseudomonas oryzihabitans]
MPITLESPDQPEVIALIAELDAYQDDLYPPESRHALDLTSLMQPNVLFLVTRDAGGQALGCAAMVLNEGYGEIKCLYVSPSGRGQGLGRRLLSRLEAEALTTGCERAMLETGPYQPEALALYGAASYERRGPFGAYRDNPLSVFMEKWLALIEL